MSDKIEDKLPKAGDKVLYANGWYEVVGMEYLFDVPFVVIYDEPPSKHTDLIKLSSVTQIRKLIDQ